MESSFPFALATVVTAAAAAVIALAATAVARPGLRRAGLIATGLPLALVPVLLASVYAASRVRGHFGGLLNLDSRAEVLAACASLWQLQRIAWGALAALCLLGLALGLASARPPSTEPACSQRRAAVLLALPLLALLLGGAASREVAKLLRVAAALAPADGEGPSRWEQVDAALEAEGFRTRGKGALMRVGVFLDQRSLAATFGGAAAVLTLVGLALTGTILAWRAAPPPPFPPVATALWLLGATLGGLLAAGVGSPLPNP
jgi:hypothetical protein